MIRSWATVAVVVSLATATAALAAGETIVVEDATPHAPLDPQAYSNQRDAQLHFVTCARLYTYPDEPGAGGTGLRPEVATAAPAVSNGGRTYTIGIRPEFRFSSGAPVTAESFLRAIERLRSPAVSSPATRAYVTGMTATQSAQGELVLQYTDPPAFDVATSLSLPAFCPVPAEAPLDAVAPDTLPTAGPYYVASAAAGEWVLAQNPHYGGARIRNLGKIVWRHGRDTATSVANVESGSSDYTPRLATAGPSPLPADRIGELHAQYGPGSPAAADGHQQLFVNASGVVATLGLNTERGPLGDERVRRAIAYAVDRTAFARELGLFALATDQLLAPGWPGYTDHAVYPFTPDVAVAQGLLREAGVGQLVLTVFTPPGRAAVVSLLSRQLEPLNIVVVGRVATSTGAFFTALRDGDRNWDVASVNWVGGTADAGSFLPGLFRTGSPQNFARFSDAGIDARLLNASTLPLGPDRDAAWSDLDRDLSRTAAWVPLYNDGAVDFFSSRIGCQSYHVVYGINLNLLCVRVAAVVAPGGTVSTGATATPDSPLQTAVTSPAGGAVSIQQGVTSAAAPGFTLLAQELTIEAPPGTAAQPLRLAFTLDASALGTADPASVTPFRDGVPLGACGDATGTASPDPCVGERVVLPDGDLHLVILSSHASVWSFGVVDPAGLVATFEGRLRELGVAPAAARVLAKTVGVAMSLPGRARCPVLRAAALTTLAAKQKHVPSAAVPEILARIEALRRAVGC